MSSFPSVSSSRWVRIRCSTSISASERPFVVITEGLSMAEMDAGDRVGLTLTRDCLFLFGRDGRRIAPGATLVAPARAELTAARG